jgi:hypothetical protein
MKTYLEASLRLDKSGGALWKPMGSPLEVGLKLDKSNTTIGQVWWGSLESGPDSLEAGGFTGQVP